MLRCYQLGLSLTELTMLDYGEVIDMMTEAGNDHEEWTPLASQKDFDRF